MYKRPNSYQDMSNKKYKDDDEEEDEEEEEEEEEEEYEDKYEDKYKEQEIEILTTNIEHVIDDTNLIQIAEEGQQIRRFMAVLLHLQTSTSCKDPRPDGEGPYYNTTPEAYFTDFLDSYVKTLYDHHASRKRPLYSRETEEEFNIKADAKLARKGIDISDTNAYIKYKVKEILDKINGDIGDDLEKMFKNLFGRLKHKRSQKKQKKQRKQ